MPKVPDMNVLYEPLFEDDYEWARDNAGRYLDTIRQALQGGATPEGIFDFYMRQAPHREPFWLRLKHAAAWIQERGK